jgi:hypothetical protein
MRRVSQFLQAVLKHWGVLVTGGFAIGVLGIWQGTGHPVRPWVYWIVAIVGLLVAFFKAWNDQVNEKEKALTRTEEIQRELEASPNAADPGLALLRERQKLEAELQPLLEIEESGFKVIPTMKVGKDESDYRKERIERLRRDIAVIGRQLDEQREAGISPVAEWQELASKFKQASHNIRADWSQTINAENQTILDERWMIRGNARAECEALCKYAGAMLTRSPHVLSKLSEGVRSQTDPIWRWLYFLKELKRSHDVAVGNGIMKDSTKTISAYESIDDLASVSAIVCIECSADEI